MSLAVTATACESPTGMILLSALVAGGVAPFTYAWTPVSGVTFNSLAIASPDLSIVDGGSYTFTVTVTDSTPVTPLTAAASVTAMYRRHFNYFQTNAAADFIAGTLPASLIPAYLALTDPLAKAATLLKASRDVDNGMKYQGARYNLVYQKLEFPRMAHIPSTRSAPTAYGYPGGAVPAGGIWGEVVWDIDPRTNQAIVPNDVYAAVIYQANFIAWGGSDRIRNQHEGVRDDSTGGLREAYDPSAPGVQTKLCMDAYMVLKKYQLAGGRLL
jgi:hypothetical protein